MPNPVSAGCKSSNVKYMGPTLTKEVTPGILLSVLRMVRGSTLTVRTLPIKSGS
jgi:hypothetical protein